MHGRIYTMAGDDVTDTVTRAATGPASAPNSTGGPGGLGGLGTLGGPGSIGASVWELLHPAQVQNEARAVGAPVPPIMDIITGAVNDIGTTAQDNVTAGLDTFAKTGQWVVVGLVAYAAIQLLNEAKRK